MAERVTRTPEGWVPAPDATAAALGPGQLALLAAAVLAALLPHAASLPAWVLAGPVGAALWRLGVAAGKFRMPGTLVRALLTFTAAFAVVATYRRISGLDAGSALLVTMMALKLLETRTRRDRAIVVYIAWFLLFAGFLREQSLQSVPQLAVGVLAGLLALGASLRPAGRLALSEGAAVTGRLLLQALPLAVALFVLFPRLPGPFWAVPVGGGPARSGLSENMSPGDISSLALSDEVAFRVRFTDASPRPEQLYWRGPVLDQFDGRSWRAGVRPAAVRGGPWPAPGASVYDYELILEPHGQRWLVPLDAPLDWDLVTARVTPAAELESEQPVERRLGYRARSAAGGSHRPVVEPGRLETFVPPRRNARTLAFAADLRAASGSPADFARRVLAHFREQPFRYTLKPPLLGENAVDDFLFSTRAGFCEHYASAFALLARAAGIPARVVTGYQGGEWNPIGSYWIVRQSDAHAWTELWIGGRWVRYDPTGAVAPERIEAGLEAALPVEGRTALPLLGAAPWVERLALSWDAVNANWDRWVLAFGPDRQADLLEELGFEAPELADVAFLCAIVVAGLMLVLTLAGTWRREEEPDALRVAWDALCRKLAPVARPRLATEGPAEYAEAVAHLRPDLAPAVQALARRYLELRYEGIATAADAARYRRAVRHFRPARRPARDAGPG